MTFEEYGK